MAFEEEILEAPQTTTGDTPPIDDTIDASAFEGVAKMGDNVPKGTYHLRLDSYTERWNDRYDENGHLVADADGKTIQDPVFSATWKIQEEPHVGRVVFDNIPWVRPEDKAAAKAGDPAARAWQDKRLIKANSILYAASYKPNGSFSFRDFLNTNPELKAIVIEKERVSKDPNGKWVGTGEMKNQIQKYMSLHKPS